MRRIISKNYSVLFEAKVGYKCVLEKFLKTRQKLSQAVVEWKRSGSKKIVAEFHDAFIGSNLEGSACAKPSEFGKQSNCKGNGSNNTGLNGTCSDSASESNFEDLPIDFNNENNKMEQSAKGQIKDQNENKLEEEQQINSPLEDDAKIHDHTINWNTASYNTRKKRKEKNSECIREW